MAEEAATTFRLRRVHDDPEPGDGRRVLVDRLWPRGISKQRAALDTWCREIAPSTELRKWYGHAPERFTEFARRYRAELAEPERAALVTELRGTGGTVTLLTATKDVPISGAEVLRQVLTEPG